MLLILLLCFALVVLAEVVTIPVHTNLDSVKERLSRRDLGGSRSYQDVLRDRARGGRSYQLTSNDNVDQSHHRVEVTVSWLPT
jgi:hypothetical protein